MLNLDQLKDTALQLDQEDTLQGFRNQFYGVDDHIYMDGNSLGLMSKKAEQSVLRVLQDWKELGIDGWMNGDIPWYYYAEKSAEIQASLLGAKPNEVIVTGSTTVNLHQLMATFYRPQGNRKKILADALNFPTDIYALQSQVQLHGFDVDETLLLVPSEDGRTINEKTVVEWMDRHHDEIAIVMLPAVLYRSGQLLDMAYLTKEAHDRGLLIGFDLCHSAGSVEHDLHEWGVDFAFWCNYKYFNSGPGSVASLYVHEKHHGAVPGLAGWFGTQKDKQFDMSLSFEPEPSAGGFQIGTPHMLSMAPVHGSMQLFQEAGMTNIRKKSLALTDYLVKLVQAYNEQVDEEKRLTIGTPLKAENRGGHIALEHSEAPRICKALKDAGVIPDFRSPNVIRLAPVALYTRFIDVYHMMTTLAQIMNEEQYKKYEQGRDVVA
ncbi:kynureninase [Caldalkalibacillus salinus]|uniref:kynureninase n=1 Tax=Caldalkalibacillus salinus TaxID=2803787 RepID=UPI0019222666|nr:kynureninase [Caldalkalibacillus salinus]